MLRRIRSLIRSDFARKRKASQEKVITIFGNAYTKSAMPGHVHRTLLLSIAGFEAQHGEPHVSAAPVQNRGSVVRGVVESDTEPDAKACVEVDHRYRANE
jgi:hypothetical protein